MGEGGAGGEGRCMEGGGCYGPLLTRALNTRLFSSMLDVNILTSTEGKLRGKKQQRGGKKRTEGGAGKPDAGEGEEGGGEDIVTPKERNE